MAFWPYGVLFRKTFYNVVNAIICCWILKECNLSSKIVKNCRIIGLNRAKKTKFWPRSVWLKKQRLTVLFTSDVMKNYIWKAGLHATRFVAKIYLQSNLVEQRGSGLVFYFGHPFRQRNATCKLAATEDHRVFHKIIFRGCPVIRSLSNGVFRGLSIKLKWRATGLFRLGRICSSGLIYSDRTWLLFFGVHIRLLTRRKICFTLGL